MNAPGQGANVAPHAQTTHFPKKSSATNTLRIIGGRWRGRRLAFPDAEGLRPTGDRIRETLFNWLAPHIVGSRCLDAFTGSGALGLEAASRGAETVVLLDQSALVTHTLRDHLHQLDHAEGVQVEQTNTLAWLERGTDTPFDVVFLDPPFDAELLNPVLSALQAGNWLAPEALIYIETAPNTPYDTPPGWQPLRAKQSGGVDYRLYQAGT